MAKCFALALMMLGLEGLRVLTRKVIFKTFKFRLEHFFFLSSRGVNCIKIGITGLIFGKNRV